MQDYNFSLENLRFHLKKKNTLILYGWYREDNPHSRTLAMYLDEQQLDIQTEIKKGLEIRQKYIARHANVNEEVRIEVTLPEDWMKYAKLRLVCIGGQEQKVMRTFSTDYLKEIADGVAYYVETWKISGENGIITGWATGEGAVELQVLSEEGQPLQTEVERYYRKDVNALYEEVPADYQAGFQVKFQIEKGRRFQLQMTAPGQKSIYKSSYKSLAQKQNKESNRVVSPGMIQKISAYYKKNGFAATLVRVKTKLMGLQESVYKEWREEHLITAEELEKQRRTTLAYEPLFSIVIPLYRTPKKYLLELVNSIQAQTYKNWELCLADGSGADESLTPLLEKLVKQDARIRFETLKENAGIAGNTNAAIKMAKGDYVVFADHDDILPPEALFTCAQALNEDKTIDMIYSDEDKVSMNGKNFAEPNFKPDINIDMLCSMNYICHLCVVKRELLERTGLLRKEFDGAQDYDFIFRCVEQADNIHHIPKVLYHWRSHINSTAANPESKLYAFEAGRRAIEAHYERMGIPARVEHAQYYGMYHTIYQWQETPLVSILIPNKDHTDDLKTCVDSILEKSTYRNLEFVIIENNSTKEETFKFYRELEAAHDNIRVIYYEGDFNFSKINNFGAQHAKGEYLLLLNNDTEIISPDTIGELLGCCMREDVGIVGAKLNYADDTIQHAGVVIGFAGIAGHTFIGSSRYDLGYQGRITCAQDYSAVTAACMMTKKSVYEEVGGLTEELKVAFNDIDYCLKVREAGKLVVYNPYAELYHYESKSRGLEDTPEKLERFHREVEEFQRRWRTILEQGDPYYNPNLTLDKADFSLK